ncbi:hypothetical protein D3C72_1273560 [compost metagenome]
MGGRNAVRAGQFHVLARGGLRLCVAVAGEARIHRQACAGRLGAIQVLAAEHAHRQRRIGQKAHAFVMGEFRQADLEHAVQQAVGVLDRRDARQVLVFGVAQELADAPRRLVGHADVADLAGAHEILQHGQRFLDRDGVLVLDPGIVQLTEGSRGAVRPMELVQIQVVRLQAFQAGVQRLGQVLAVQEGLAVADVAGTLGIAHGARHLAGQHDVLATLALGQPGADVGFRQALRFGLGRHRVHFGHVDQIDAALQRVVQLLVRFGFGVLLAPGHGAQPDQADIQVGTAEFAVFQVLLRAGSLGREATPYSKMLAFR